MNEMHGSRSKIPSKKSRQAALREGFNSGVKGLIYEACYLCLNKLDNCDWG
jgi:hypothetical protein